MPESIAAILKRPAPVVAMAGVSAEWMICVRGEQISWDWATPPDPRSMERVRAPRSKGASRHVPVWAFSATTREHLHLESGLEHDLVRELDRRREAIWLVSQPARLRLPVKRNGRRVEHTPDLLSVTTAGEVTVWDVRAAVKQDEDFKSKSENTRVACHAVGWAYEVFEGFSSVHRTNLMWLNAYRQPMPWYGPSTDELVEILGAEGRIGDVVAADSGAGHLTSAMWHSIWAGTFECDMEAPFLAKTKIRFTGPVTATS